MTEDQFLDALAEREGTKFAEPPAIDQPTGPYGIVLATLTLDRGHLCTVAELKNLPAGAAREVARRKIQRDVIAAGLNQIGYEPLRWQVLDFGYESGMARAIRWLQRTVGLSEPFVTGSLDGRTLLALNRLPGPLVNNALAGERAHAAYHGGTEPQFAAGVARRAIEFILPLDAPTMTTT